MCQTCPRSQLDEYELIGELHDLFLSEETWSPIRPVLQELFGELGDSAVVMDIGAGTGLGVDALSRVFDGRIAAVEPSAMMRAGLLTRISTDEDLAGRVRIIAEPAPAAFAQLTGPIDGFLCTHMLGYLSGHQRREMFAQLEQRMAPGASGLVTADRHLAPPSGRSVEQHRRLGGLDYVARFLPQPDGLVQRYEVRDGGTVLRSVEAVSRWQPVTQAALAAEAAPAGFELVSRGDGLATLRRSPFRTPPRTAQPTGRRH
ncbi:class I SAM-dependent methyltransferase [Nesterenkonia sp. K-15-9-6]|uniref:class I SAM-dependent methyltransferase n=1 Tax=Nesterenkonia sp. K-15-9-6 TaxID=3093918 RepID=UPI004044DC55